MSPLKPAPSSPRKIRCLVIQLTRLGDTLQSLMALRAAKQLYPNLEITFVARERFAAAAKRVPWLTNVVTFPSDKILAPVLKGEVSQAQALRDLARWLSPLVTSQWDLIVNWSYSESSSFLTGILPGRVKLGYSRASDTSFSCPDGWSHYIQAIVQGGIHQNIHLTDVLTTQLLTELQIHAGDPADNGDAPVTSKNFFDLQTDVESELGLGTRWRDPAVKWIAIQLGAGRDSKTWEPESWATLVDLILKKHPEYGVVLLGGEEDQERADRFLSSLKNPHAVSGESVVSLVGQSGFDLWASVISRCQWLMSGDTAAVHLASVLGTRVLNLAIGPVYFGETGPYGNGHYVVTAQKDCEPCQDRSSPATHSCGARLKPEAVYAAWTHGNLDLATRRQTRIADHFTKLGFDKELEAVRVYRTRIRGTQEGGGVVYDPLMDHPMQLADWTSMVLGHVARAWYCGWVPPIGTELARARISPALVQKLRELEESSQLLSKICEEASRTALILNRRSARLRSDKVMRIGDRDELRALGTKLLELDQLIDRLGKTHAPLQGFAQMSKVLMHNLKADQLAELGRESADCYRQLADGVGILRDWLKHTLELAKPVAVRRETLTLVERL